MRSVVFYVLVAAAIISFALFAYASHASLGAVRQPFVVLAWNETGSAGPATGFDLLNGLRAQVIRRGNPPRVVADGIVVEYRIIKDREARGRVGRRGFWDRAWGLLGVRHEGSGRGAHGWGGLAGCMRPEGDHFNVEGLPVANIGEYDRWEPYRKAEITVRDRSGNELARTQAAVPTSDEHALGAGGGISFKCSACHEGLPDYGKEWRGFGNAKGHGGLYCPGCHDNPHDPFPSREASDIYQAMQYQPPREHGRLSAISSCAACHDTSRGPSGWSTASVKGFLAAHAGAKPKSASGCNICHTAFSADTKKWPHGSGWR